MDVKEEFDGERLAHMEIAFEQQIFAKLVEKVRFRLNTPATLECTMPNGQKRSYPFIGDETFKLVGARVEPIKNRHGVERHWLKLRLAPLHREEYRYIEIAKEGVTENFDGSVYDAESKSWTDWRNYAGVLEAVLDQRDEKTLVTFRDQIDAVLCAERAKLQREALSSHKDFGSW
jgi:hypothetical protein